MEFKLDDDLQAALTAFLMSQGPWVVVAVIFVFMLPKIIPAASAALAEQRKISHKREENLRKIRNNAAPRLAPPPSSPATKQGTGRKR